VYVELNGKSYVRDAQFKLTGGGELFDMSKAPFEEIPVAKDMTDGAAAAARRKLQAVLDEHKAAPGHANGQKATKKQKQRARRKAGINRTPMLPDSTAASEIDKRIR